VENLERDKVKPLEGEGPIPSDVVFLGDYPGFWEVKYKRLWAGKSGAIMDSMLWSKSLDRSNYFFTNLLKFPPEKEGHVTREELKRDEKMLQWELDACNPSIVVTLGRNPTRTFLGDVDMEAVHGIPILGQALGHAVTVIPCFSPAAGLYSTESLKFSDYDLGQAALVIKGKMHPQTRRDAYPNPLYIELTSVSEIRDLLPKSGKIWVDTEGWPWDPWCLTFTNVPGQAYMIRAKNEHLINYFDQLCKARKLRLVFHNSMHDVGVLRAMGIEVDAENIDDTMVKLFELGIEPQGLKPASLRHACMEMDSYESVTQEADRRIALEFLQKVDAVDWGEADPILHVVKGVHKVKKPQGLNRRVSNIVRDVEVDKRNKDGEPVDPRDRWEDVEPSVRGVAEERFGRMPYFTFDAIPLQKAIHYACRDADATCRVDPKAQERLEALDLEGVYALDMSVVPLFERMQSNGILIKKGYFEPLGEEFSDRMDGLREDIEAYGGGGYLNPNSSDQTALLLFDKLRLAPVKYTKKGRKPSTNAKTLEALKGEHPVVPLIVQWREFATMKNRFCNKLPIHASYHEDYRVRGNIRITRVATGRPSMTKPNLLAIPTRTDEGGRIRDGFVASPGKKLASADYNQIEMRYFAHLSQDENLCRMFNEGLDVHTQTAMRMFGIKEHEVHPKKHRYPAKRVGFGVITGITGSGLYDQMRLAGIFDYDVKACDEIIRDWYKIYPGGLAYIEAARGRAKRQGYARCEGGRIRLLPGVHCEVSQIKEEALRQSHSFEIQGGAATIMKRAMFRIWGILKDFWEDGIDIEPLLQIYDEMIFEFDEEVEDLVTPVIIQAMKADSGKYRVPIEIGWGTGRTWGELK
jgi:uracil-DNA glycosylase family 4